MSEKFSTRTDNEACKKSDRTAYAIAATGTTYDASFTFGGNVLTRYVLECYDATNAVTRTLSIIDANSITVWSGSAHADASKNSIPVDVELCGTYTFRITLSGVAGGTGTDYLTLYLR